MRRYQAIKPNSICATCNSEKSAILIMTVGVMIMVAMLALALIMLSTSQMFLVQTQKKELQGFYVAESQILWAAYKIQENPGYRGSDDSIYGDTEAEEVVITVTNDGELIDLKDMAKDSIMPQEEIDEFLVSVYVKFPGIFGKKESAVRLDATIERIVEEGPIIAHFKITTKVKDWHQVKPPTVP